MSATDLLKKLWASKYTTAVTIAVMCAAAVLKELGVIGVHWHFLGEATTLVLAAEKLLADKPTTIPDVIADVGAKK